MNKYMNNKKDLYNELKTNATQYEYLHHFTQIENFQKIIEQQCLLLNRIDRVTDKNENIMLPNLWKKKVFIGCFTHSNKGKKEFWEVYAKNNGVRISFPNHLLNKNNFTIISENNYQFKKRSKSNWSHIDYEQDDKNWGYFDILKNDIFYNNVHNWHNYENCGNALVKNYTFNDHYDWEEETRLRIALAPLGLENQLNEETNKLNVTLPDFNKIYLKLNKKILENIFISVPANANEQFIIKVARILSSTKNTKNCRIFKLYENGDLVEWNNTAYI